jgi:hypothetical protein
MAFVTAAAETLAAPTGPGGPDGHVASTHNVIRHTARRDMKKAILVIAIFILVNSCSDENSTAPEHEPIQPLFTADSLRVNVWFDYGLFEWIADAGYKCKFEGYSGKIHTHAFTFIDLGLTLFDRRSTADCYFQIGEETDRWVGITFYNDDLGNHDSVTVYLTLTGQFQDCSGGTVDSIAPISWSGFSRAKVIE